MPLALDFGTSNTVLALWDTDRQDGRTIHLPGLSLTGRHGEREHHYVPSLIHYDGDRVRVGRQVLEEELLAHPATFQLMKGFVSGQMKLPRRLGGRTVDNFQAAGDFLRQVLIAAGAYADLANEEVAFTVPVEGFEHYQNWLEETVQAAGVARPRFLDEPSAAALGYSARLRPGQPFLVFDFGGGTLDVAVVRPDETAGGERRCRNLGKAGAQVGGKSIDDWLARHVVQQARLSEAEARGLMGLLLAEARRVKETLSAADAEDLQVMDPNTGRVLQRRVTRSAFEDLLEANGLYSKLNTILDLAEAGAREMGYDRQSLQAVFMIGGSSLIPSVRRLVRARYGELVRCERPFEAVAVGAAAYVAGAAFDDRVRHEYALKGGDQFVTVVEAGTPYPCTVMNPKRPQEPLVLTLKALNEGQTKFGLQFYEVAHHSSVACGGGGLDLIFDQNGTARYTRREDVEDAIRRGIGAKECIPVNPPAQKGQPRLHCTFTIDAQKRLCTTVKDLLTGKTLLRDHPLVKLR